jgi:hypothetical protein
MRDTFVRYGETELGLGDPFDERCLCGHLPDAVFGEKLLVSML